MKINIFITICAVIAISACSSPGSRERTSGDYAYMQAKEKPDDLLVPEDLERPIRSNRYDLPILESGAGKQILGSDIRISSPRLVLPLVAGSHVEEGSVAWRKHRSLADVATCRSKCCCLQILQVKHRL